MSVATTPPRTERSKSTSPAPRAKTQIDTRRLVDLEGQLAAINRAQAVIEFELDGTIITANDNFLAVMGYTLAEVQGGHHRMFVDPQDAQSVEYGQFWERLARGEYVSQQFHRIANGGRDVWLQASYNPIFDTNGTPFKVVKYATDITAAKQHSADVEGQLAAINRAQAVIEFELDGTIITANDNFLGAMGYTLAEVQGGHHSMFVDPAEAQSPEYATFWQRLRSGEFVAAEFRRLGNNAREVWIQASYNPIFDANGNPYKVVKYATDITEQVELIKRVTDAVVGLGTTAQQLGQVATDGGATAVEMSAQAETVAAATEQLSATITTVAVATEEMSATISEIAHNSSEASAAAMQAATETHAAKTMVARLGESSLEIGKILQVITSIAQQTNLLALNATIEAARAGDVGKGFAVVANEVKELAKASAGATDDIAKKIEAIQSSSADVVQAIEGISEVITKVSDLQTSVAAAVEEQSAATNEIGRNTSEAAEASREIASTVSSVAEAAGSTTVAATQTEQAATELEATASGLRELVSKFDY